MRRSWIFFSNVTILFNKWLIDTAGFRKSNPPPSLTQPHLTNNPQDTVRIPSPATSQLTLQLTPAPAVLLTTWHLIFATLATQLLARTTTLLTTRNNIRLTPRFYVRTILPIGILYSGSLVCSNLVYLYLSVAFIQMLKAAAPVAVLVMSWIWGVADPSAGTLFNILVIVFGVAMASFGEIEFSWIGFVYQWGGIIFESMRLVMIQVMLSGEGLRMDPLVGLYYYAPVCAVMNLLVAVVIEVPYFRWEDVVETGFGMLFLNALIAFMLNVVSVVLVSLLFRWPLSRTNTFRSARLLVWLSP